VHMSSVTMENLHITVQDKQWVDYSANPDINLPAGAFLTSRGLSSNSMHSLSPRGKWRHTHELFSLKLSSYPASTYQTPPFTVILQIYCFRTSEMYFLSFIFWWK
jgi:hypothetical protein